MLEIRSSRSGETTARINGVSLHSPYDPPAEARRFAEQHLKNERPATVLLLGAELGYGIRAVRKRLPEARLLAVFYDAQLFDHCFARSELAAAWQPRSGEPLIAFLRAALDELSAEGLAILEWPASARIFPQTSLEAHRQLAQLLRELRGGLATTAALGRRWLRNSLLNFVSIEGVLPPGAFAASGPILIAASGPSLEQCLPSLTRLGGRLTLWALPSAAGCLRERGLAPDLIVLTDPGYYAVSHLNPLARSAASVAMPLSAAMGAWRLAGGILLLCQEAAYEKALLQAAGYEAPLIPPQGTVAATAMGLALRLTAREVILAGLDFCFDDIRSHARPNLFEALLHEGASRLAPFEHRLFDRAAEQAPRRLSGGKGRAGLALETYAGWFSSLPPRVSSRLYRLNPSPVATPGIRSLSNEELERMAAERSEPRLARAPLPGYPGRDTRLAIARDLLEGWLALSRRALSELARRASPEPLFADPFLTQLAYHFDAAGLAEVRRVQRLQGEAEAARRATGLMERQAGFLLELHSRLETRG